MKLDNVARAICCPNGCENAGYQRNDLQGRVAICQAHTYAKMAVAAVRAYLSPSAGEIEAAAREIACCDWDFTAERWDHIAAQIARGDLKHGGDCTNESHTCYVCQLGKIRDEAAAALLAARRAALAEIEQEMGK